MVKRKFFRGGYQQRWRWRLLYLLLHVEVQEPLRRHQSLRLKVWRRKLPLQKRQEERRRQRWIRMDLFPNR